jgi:predicted MFS family arabinose efflux permease
MNFSPWNTSAGIELPTYGDGNRERQAVIEGSEKSVLVMDQKGVLLYRLKAKRNAKQTFSAAKFAVLDDRNNLYVLDANFNGYMEQNVERVLHYSPKGGFLGEPYTFAYTNEDFIITKGKIAGMTWFDGVIYLVRLENNGFWLEQAGTSNQDSPRESVFFAYPQAFRDLVYFHINPEDKVLTATTMAGSIKQYHFSGDLFFDCPAEGNSLPWTAVSDSRNSIIYSDLTSREIVRLDTASRTRISLFTAPPEESPYYRINYKQGILFAASYDNMLVLNEWKTEIRGSIFHSYSYSFFGNAVRLLWFILFVLGILGFFSILIGGVLLLRRKKPGVIFIRIMLITFGVAMGAAISSILIIDEMNKQYYEQVYSELENISRLMAMTIDTEVLTSLKVPSQYDDETYIRLKEDMRRRFSQLPFKGKGIYQILWIEQDGEVYMMYDLESSTGIFFPFAAYEGSIYQQVLESKEYIHTREITSEGSWLLVMGPIFDSAGNILGLIESGYMMTIVQEHIRDMVIQTVLIVLSSTAALLLIVIEFILFMGAYQKNKYALKRKPLSYQSEQFKAMIIFLRKVIKTIEKEQSPQKALNLDKRLLRSIVGSLLKRRQEIAAAGPALPFRPELLRAVGFFMFMTINLASAILPIYAANLYSPLLGLPKEFVITLPIFADMVCAALALLVIPLILEKAGVKKISLMAAMLIAFGNGLCFIAPDMRFLTIGYALSGFASGAVILVLNTVIGSQKEELDVNSGFAHFNASYLAGVNVGVVLGSILAQFFPYRLVFVFSSITGLGLFGITFFSLNSKMVNYLYNIKYAKKTKGKKNGLLRFLFHPVVLGSLFLLLLPYTVSLSFTSYFMPVYGIEKGLKESNIGQLILLSGLFAILFGAPLCEYVLDRFPVKAIIFMSLLLNIGAIYLFSFNTSMAILAAAVVLTAIGNIFILTNIQTLYAMLYQHEDVSSMKALSVFSAVENLSLAIGPIVFSYILAGDIRMGLKLFASGFLICLIIFMLISNLGQRNRNI